MSLITWAEAHYPITALKATKNLGYPITKEQWLTLLDQSILKWEGLRPEVTAEHNLTLRYDELKDLEGRVLEIDANSCALCRAVIPGCGTCPLYRSRDYTGCDDVLIDEEGDRVEKKAPYQTLRDDGDPEPMIEALKKARVWLLKQG